MIPTLLIAAFFIMGLGCTAVLLYIHIRVVRERDRLQKKLVVYSGFVLASQIALKGPTAEEVEAYVQKTMTLLHGIPKGHALKFAQLLIEQRRAGLPSL